MRIFLHWTFPLLDNGSFLHSSFSDTQRIFSPEGGIGADVCQVCESVLADRDPLGLSADLDDLQTAVLLVPRVTHMITRADTLMAETHLLQLLRCVQHGADDHDSVQQVQRDPVWRADVLGPPGGATNDSQYNKSSTAGKSLDRLTIFLGFDLNWIPYQTIHSVFKVIFAINFTA